MCTLDRILLNQAVLKITQDPNGVTVVTKSGAIYKVGAVVN